MLSAIGFLMSPFNPLGYNLFYAPLLYSVLFSFVMLHLIPL